MHSIAHRVSAGFFGFALLIVVLSLLAYGHLRSLESDVHQEIAMSALADEVMEMRRLEKSFLLYREPSLLGGTLQQAESALGVFGNDEESYRKICQEYAAPPPRCLDLGQDLSQHAALLKELVNATPEEIDRIGEKLRFTGFRVSQLVLDLAARERMIVAESVESSIRWLSWTVLLVWLLGAWLGSIITRSIVGPLRKLEAALAPIAAGRFTDLRAPTQDRELVSFADAFNRMLAELENRNRQLLHSEKLAALGVLVSGVAHELNNPLSNISSSCQLALEEEGNSTETRAWLLQIDEQTERARQIVLALSDYARRRPLAVEPVLIDELLDATHTLVCREIGRNIPLESDTPPGFAVLADQQRLQRVFINLLKNAADAGGPGAMVKVRGRGLEEGDSARFREGYHLGEIPSPEDRARYVLIVLEDDGPGMPPEVVKQIFDPFFTTRDVGRGMGLGLYIVQEIVKEMNGCIAVDSVPGRGTRFDIALPAAV